MLYYVDTMQAKAMKLMASKLAVPERTRFSTQASRFSGEIVGLRISVWNP